MTGAELKDRVMTSKDIRESKALEDYLQRDLKPRVSKIATYIQKRNDRFFNSIILGVFDALPEWIQLDLRSLAATLGTNDSEHLEDTIGVLVFSGGEKMFAIDGQHRVEGIKLAHGSHNKFLDSDQYSVLMVAHVDDSKGKVRTRRLFCDINKNAVAVSEGDKVIIDEDDICAIVTRRIFAEYHEFGNGKEIAVSERKEVLTTVDSSGKTHQHFTSLLALYTVAKKLKPLCARAKGSSLLTSENIEELRLAMEEFFDFIFQVIPSYSLYFKGKAALATLRKENRNLLFRPIGLEILSRVYVVAYKSGELDNLRDMLPKIKFTNPGGPLDGVVWVAGKIKAGSKEKGAAVDLILLLCGLFSTTRHDELKNRLRVITQDEKYELPDLLD